MRKFNRQGSAVRAGETLRIQATEAFRLHWTGDEWQACADTVSAPTALGIHFVDIPVERSQRAPLRFTFFWPAGDRREGRDFAVAVETGD